MKTKTFGDKKIIIRKIKKSDLKNVKNFQVFINSFVKEEAKILRNKKLTKKDEVEFIKRTLTGVKDRTTVQLVAEYNNKIIGTTNIKLYSYRRNHIGEFGIIITQGYRGIGLGEHLMSEIIKLAKKELKPKAKIIQLEVYINNRPAINLYKKLGFRTIAKLPKQIQYKGKLISELIMMRNI